MKEIRIVNDKNGYLKVVEEIVSCKKAIVITASHMIDFWFNWIKHYDVPVNKISRYDTQNSQLVLQMFNDLQEGIIIISHYFINNLLFTNKDIFANIKNVVIDNKNMRFANSDILSSIVPLCDRFIMLYNSYYASPSLLYDAIKILDPSIICPKERTVVNNGYYLVTDIDTNGTVTLDATHQLHLPFIHKTNLNKIKNCYISNMFIKNNTLVSFDLYTSGKKFIKKIKITDFSYDIDDVFLYSADIGWLLSNFCEYIKNKSMLLQSTEVMQHLSEMTPTYEHEIARITNDSTNIRHLFMQMKNIKKIDAIEKLKNKLPMIKKIHDSSKYDSMLILSQDEEEMIVVENYLSQFNIKSFTIPVKGMHSEMLYNNSLQSMNEKIKISIINDSTPWFIYGEDISTVVVIDKPFFRKYNFQSFTNVDIHLLHNRIEQICYDYPLYDALCKISAYQPTGRKNRHSF